MRLLVTGGAGFIGTNFIRHWLEKHPADGIVNFDKLTYAGNLENLKGLENNPHYKFIKGDITDTHAVLETTEGIDFVVHFAAESHVDRSIMDPSLFVRTNVLGTQVLLEAALKNKVKFIKSNLQPASPSASLGGKNVPQIKFDIILANLPYLNPKQLKEPSIKKEPRLALLSGKDGLYHYRKLFTQIAKYLSRKR